MEQGLRYDPDTGFLEGKFTFREDSPPVAVTLELDEYSLETDTLVVLSAIMYTEPADDSNPYKNKYGYIAIKQIISLVIAWAKLHEFKRIKGEFDRLNSSSSATPGTRIFDIRL